MIEFILNDRHIRTDKPGGMTLLDFIRYENRLVGTKIGCREGDCGACTVLLGELHGDKVSYISMTSCITPLSNAAEKHVVTIEGLNMNELSPVQKAFIETGGTQCGFCTVGFVVSLTGYCIESGKANHEDAIGSMDGNICRCTGYKSIERAAAMVAEQLGKKQANDPIGWLIRSGFIPGYFEAIPKRLAAINKPTGSNGRNGKSSLRMVGGGTDLYVQRHEELMDAGVNGLFDRKDLKKISRDGSICRVGASATVTDLLESAVMTQQFPKLLQHFKLISSTQIRNMGTIAGNLVNASPIGDLTIFFLALNSSVTLVNAAGKSRSISLKDFYKGYKKLDKKEDEYVETLTFNPLDSNTQFNFEKVSKRRNLDIASVNSAMRITTKGDSIVDVYISAGGVGPVPIFLAKTSAFLKGKELAPQVVSEAAEIIEQEISPITDARGTREYKALLLRQLFFAHFIELFSEKFEMATLG